MELQPLIWEHAVQSPRGRVHMGKGSRLATATLLTAATLSCLSACTVPVGAVTGLSVTADGKPAAVVVVCHGHINAAVLNWGDPRMNKVMWNHDGDITDFAVWPLSGGDGWKANKPVPRFTADTVYWLAVLNDTLDDDVRVGRRHSRCT
jgi:hypothetical protein